MERSICIHGHFYQPPRENPWLEETEIQDSAYPYHDWNERVTAECYAPNSASRFLDREGRIREIVNNYSGISFDFGPTLLHWMERHAPEAYGAILSADRQSIKRHSGHGNALAQAYNHLIMPLANSRDKKTQILWGIRDFEFRFKRPPEGMWLPETAVDGGTLDMLAEFGIRFTILAPHQVSAIREIGTEAWEDMSSAQIDPSRPYLCALPSGREIALFFYDGPISKAVAFEGLLTRGEDFVSRLFTGFSDLKQWPQIVSIATDGESYGHHHKFGEMALTYALNNIENGSPATLTNYGEYLERNPPRHEARIVENTSWSCAHGIERWRSNCGCNSGGSQGSNQEWRAPLRESLDWLRDELASLYEEGVKRYVKDPWSARDDYVDVILDRSEERKEDFLGRHAARGLTGPEKTYVLKAMEIQRHAMLMYTSCGWFFDELSGIETVQILQYAGRAIQLARELFGAELEDSFKERLSKAKSNIAERGDGARIYETAVSPAMVDLGRVAAHYAFCSLLKDYCENARIFCYSLKDEDHQGLQSGTARLAVGKVRVVSDITLASEMITFCGLYLGGHVFNVGIKAFSDDGAYQSMKQEITASFERGEIADAVRLLDLHFGSATYSLMHLFRDEQRRILNAVISETMEQFEQAYRPLYENNRAVMTFLRDAGMPVPPAFLTAAAFALAADVKKAFLEETPDIERMRTIVSEIRKWNAPLDSVSIEFMLRRKGEAMMSRLLDEPADSALLSEFSTFFEMLRLLAIEVNLWEIQNIYYKIARKTWREIRAKAKSGDEESVRWVDLFQAVGEKLSFNTAIVLSEDDFLVKEEPLLTKRDDVIV